MAKRGGAQAIGQIGGSALEGDALMDKLLLEDEAQGFFKDLISAAGLRSAWVDLLRRMRSAERMVAELWKTASRETLERDFVTRPEYMKAVEQEHSNELASHGKRLVEVETAAATSLATSEAHASRLEKLESGGQRREARLDELAKELARVEAQDGVRHQELLDLGKEREEALAERERKVQERLVEIGNRLDWGDHHRQSLEERIEAQQAFLESDELTQLIKTVCSEILKGYVNKEEMLREVQVSADFVVKPVREGLGDLTKELQNKVVELRDADRVLYDSIQDSSERTGNLERSSQNQFETIFKDLETRAQIFEVEHVETKLRESVSMTEISLTELRVDASKKLQELLERVLEFQTIIETHEHALQHHAEEMMNRATKYDLVVCQQRVDKCALKEKVDKDVKELQTTVTWQTDQLETLGYSKGFSGGGSVMMTMGTRTNSLQSLGGSSISGILPHRKSLAGLGLGTLGAAGAAGSVAASPVPGAAATACGGGPGEEQSVALTDSTVLPEHNMSSMLFSEGKSQLLTAEGGSLVLGATGITGGLEPMDEDAAGSAASGAGGINREGADDSPTRSLHDGSALRGSLGLNSFALGPEAFDGRGLPQSMSMPVPPYSMGCAGGMAPVTSLGGGMGGAGSTEVYGLIRMQMEALIQGVLGMSYMGSRTQGPSWTREQRQEKESELIQHMQCLLQWVMNGRAPLSWDPQKLATFALRTMGRLAGSDAAAGAGEREPSPDGMPGRAALRRNRQAGGSGSEKVWTRESKARAQEVGAADRAAILPPALGPAPLGGGFVGSRVRGFVARRGERPGSLTARPSTTPAQPGQGGGSSGFAGGIGPLTGGGAWSSRVAPLPSTAPAGAGPDALLTTAIAAAQRPDMRPRQMRQMRSQDPVPTPALGSHGGSQHLPPLGFAETSTDGSSTVRGEDSREI